MFKVFYDDEYIYDGPPFEAPAKGVVCIVDDHDTPHIHEGSDYYIWQFREIGWTGVDLFGLYDYLTEIGPRKVLFGRTVDNATYERIKAKAYSVLCDLRAKP